MLVYIAVQPRSHECTQASSTYWADVNKHYLIVPLDLYDIHDESVHSCCEIGFPNWVYEIKFCTYYYIIVAEFAVLQC